MSDVRLWDIAESFKDLHRIYKPVDLDKFTKDFMRKYKISKDLEGKLKSLVKDDKDENILHNQKDDKRPD